MRELNRKKWRGIRAVMVLAALVLLAMGSRPAEAKGAAGPIPVGSSDPHRGPAQAPVTMVVFVDLECPYCKRLHDTVAQLEQQYGKKLRIVYKHNPLPFHKEARPAALAAEAVRKLEGERAFWRFVATAFDELRGRSVDDVIRLSGNNVSAVRREIASGRPAKKIDADIALARDLGATGTPASFVSGVFVSGAQPKEAFAKVIDKQLAAARAMRARGVPASRLYAELTKKSFVPPAKRNAPRAAAPSKPAHDSTTVWKVPIKGSPALGPKNAPVTVVVFSDFQCPFCSRAVATLESLRKRYGAKLRFVFKNQPLPFHQRAEPAAQLAMEAFLRLGDRGFWLAHDKLFAQQRNLEDADLEQIAREIGLHPALAMKAVRSHKHAARIEQDQDLAADLDARGTPHFFINGRRLAGAQPEEKFAEIIDQELESTKKILGRGIPAHALYDHIMKSAKEPPPPEKKKVPTPGKGQPSRGNPQARVTIQMFTDFECPFCRRVQDTISRIEKDYGGRVRIVFRHMPLDFHTHAMAAHRAAAEAFKQGGNKAFWKMHDLLYANQSALDRASLISYARQAGLDTAAFERALDGAVHDKAIEADAHVAEKAGIRGTPAFVVNGYFLSGAQPYTKFKRVIDRALAGR